MRRAFCCLTALAAVADAFSLLLPQPLSSPPRAVVVQSSSSRYDTWEADVASFERSRDRPLVYVAPSTQENGGLGVFAARDVEEGETLTEWVGMLAPTPETLCDELEMQQNYYGPNWRAFSQRYEIGLSGTRVVDSAGVALGGDFDDSTHHLLRVDDACDVDAESCVGETGEQEFVLLGKTTEQGACAREGVAQLINDHSTIRAPPLRNPLSTMAAQRSPNCEEQGALLSRDVDGFFVSSESGLPVAANGVALEEAVRTYLSRIVPLNNVAIVQAHVSAKRLSREDSYSAPRLFAVATRSLRRGEELYFTYGLEWWLSQLRKTCVAQLVSCEPSPRRAQVLIDLVADIERVSDKYVAYEADAVREAGSMPSRYVVPLEPLDVDLRDLLSSQSRDADWHAILLKEQLSLATECPIEYYNTWWKDQGSSSSSSSSSSGGLSGGGGGGKKKNKSPTTTTSSEEFSSEEFFFQ